MVVVAVLAMTLGSSIQSPAASADSHEVALAKLDAYLRYLVEPRVIRDVDQPGTAIPQPVFSTSSLDSDQIWALENQIAVDFSGPEPVVDVYIHTIETDEFLAHWGIQPLVRFQDVVTARVPVSELLEIATNFTGISQIRAAGAYQWENDTAVEMTRTDLVREARPPYDGSGVIIALLDTGIDFFHQDFRNSDGTTRVKALLDLTRPGDTFGGTVYTESQINQELLVGDGSIVPQRDTHGHGTHVAGSAAGDGSGTAELGQYAGIAPGADLIVVKAGDDQTSGINLYAGLLFVDQTAASLGQPWVANLGTGMHAGPRDGTSELELLIDDLTGPGIVGQAVVTSAGNGGGYTTSERGTVVESTPAAPLTTTFSIRPRAGPGILTFELWYENSDDLRFGWTSPNGGHVPASDDRYPLGAGNADTWCAPYLRGGDTPARSCVEVVHSTADPANGDRQLLVHVWSQLDSGEPVPLQSGVTDWQFELEADRVVGAGGFHIWTQPWLAPDRMQAWAMLIQGFPSYEDHAGQITSPGNSRNIITVGSVNSHETRPTHIYGRVTNSSSHGPTRDGRIKPDLMAPGYRIVSSLSSDAPVPPSGFKSGTSLSAAFGSGAVALIFQQDPYLDAQQVRQYLRDNTNTDYLPFGREPDDTNYRAGWGVIDIFATLEAIVGPLIPFSDDATLGSLSISDGALNPDFLPGRLTYTVDVAHDVATIDVTPSTNQSDAVLEVDGKVAISGDPATIPLTAGETTRVTLLVTAQNTLTTETYTIDFTRPDPPLPSTDATLAALTLSDGLLVPTFVPGTTSYTASVADDVTSVDVTATTSDSAATLTIDSGSATSGAPESVTLSVGANPIPIVVTAEDGTTELTYTVTITRAEPPPSDDATLTALTLTAGTLTPGFASDTTAYTATVANAVTSIAVTATTTGSASTLTVQGSSTASGSPRFVPLSVGPNPIDIVVTAEDDSTELTYTVTVTRAVPAASDDATLSALSLSALSLSAGILAPSFASGTTAYSGDVANETSSLNVTATANDPSATLTIDGAPASDGVASSVALAVGANPIDVVVTAEDGTTELTYTVTITRVAADDDDDGGGGGGGGGFFFPPPPPPQLRVDLTVTNDDGGDAAPEDFTILLNGEIELTNGEAALLTFGGHLVSIQGPTALYSVEFGTACFEDGTVILLGGLSICTVSLDDQPLAVVLSTPLPHAPVLIDESLSLIDDTFDRDGASYVEVSSPGTPPEVVVSIPVDALPELEGITVLVSPGNELAIGQNPPPGSLLIGGTAYVIEILDGEGNPITEFPEPLEVSFLLPEGSGPVEAYSFDPETGLWVLEPGTIEGGYFQLFSIHLTTFALFEIAPDGGLVGSSPSHGSWFTTAEGGSVTQLRRALLEAGATGAFVTHQGEWVSYLPGAPDFVNQQFSDFFATGILPGQVLLVTMD